MTYSVTIRDIKDFLASLAPDESVGHPGKGWSCLVSNALKHKYKKEFIVGLTEFGTSEEELNPLTDDIKVVVDKFDNFFVEFVTRAQVEEAMPELR